MKCPKCKGSGQEVDEPTGAVAGCGTCYGEGRIEVKISHLVPDIFAKLQHQFGVSWERVFITYGDTIHSKKVPSGDLIAHESVHVRQQLEMGVELWWERYLADPKFRKEQEAEAYQRQWQFIKANVKNREEAFKMKMQIIGHFSGSMYGNLCTSAEADKMIGK